jgi:predicted small lipoprotein YifL
MAVKYRPPKYRRGALICYGGNEGLGGILAHNAMIVRSSRRLRAAFAVALLGTVALALASCGRAGPPEPPPGPALGVSPTASAAPSPAPAPLIGAPGPTGQVSQETAQRNGFDAYGNPVAPPSQRKSFPLDFLLQ